MQSIVTLTITENSANAALTVVENTQQAVLSVTDESTEVILRIEDAKGKSAYELWLDKGHVGSEEAFLAQLAAPVSLAPNNQLQMLEDGLHVPNAIPTDPLAYYILSRS